MKKELPVRHWQTLPEAELIGALKLEVPQRVERKLAQQEAAKLS